MIDLTLDLETLSTRYDATILQISAVQFDPFDHKATMKSLLSGQTLDLFIEIDNQNRHISDDTLAWWSRQPQTMQDKMFCPDNRVLLKEAIEQLRKFVWNKGRIWCQGTSFDITILEHACTQLNIPIPWQYWRARDSRTLLDLVKITLPPATHDALADCARQAYGIQQALHKLSVSKFQK